MKKTVSLFLIINMIGSPVLGHAANRIPGYSRVQSTRTLPPTPPANRLPELQSIVQGIDAGASNFGTEGNTLDIIQNSEKAIIDWRSFDIGSSASVYFKQRLDGVVQTHWVVLNRIKGDSPSVIAGKLTADAKIILANQNGVWFFNGSQVNVGALVATSLNMAQSDFLKGTLHFKNTPLDDTGEFKTDGTPYDAGAVVNYTTITTGTLGSVFFMGPEVENSGTIVSPSGQIGLAAGTEMTLTPDPTARRQYFVDYPKDGTLPTQSNIAANTESGTLYAEAGAIGMYGGVVNQDGVIRSVTTVNKAGLIELKASRKVTTGVNSRTAVELSDSAEKMIPADTREETKTSAVMITGLLPTSTDPEQYDSGGYDSTGEILHSGVIEVPGGIVRMQAVNDITLDTGRIDVSGAWVDKSADANLIEMTLTSENMADDFGQKNGFLKGEKIKVDAHQGTAIGILQGYLKGEAQTVREQYTTGGKIYLTSESGKVDVQKDASLLFKGGGIRYAGGSYATTVLYAGNKAYDISNAPQWLKYDRIGERTYYHAAHEEGADAGRVEIVAGRIGLKGKLDGSVRAGIFQTKTAADELDSLGRQAKRGLKAPVGGTLVLGTELGTKTADGTSFVEGGQKAESLDAKLGDVVITAGSDPLAENRNEDGSLKEGVSYIQDDVLSGAGLSYLGIYSNLSVTTERDSRLSLLPGGTLKIYGRRVDHGGTAVVNSGTVEFFVHGNVTSASSPEKEEWEGLFLRAGSSISVAGETIDNSLAAGGGSGRTSTAYLSGGTVTLKDITAKGKLIMEQGSVINANGGYLISAKGKLTGGNAGSITLHGYTLHVGGELQGLALAGKKGGTLSLHAGNVTLSDYAPGEAVEGQLGFSAASLEKSGFADITVKSAGNLVVGEGISLAPSRYRLRTPVPGKGSVGLTVVSDDLIGSSSITLSAGEELKLVEITALPNLTNPDDPAEENLYISGSSVIKTAPDGKIAISAPRTIEIAGTLEAPAGDITIASSEDNIWLKDGAKLLAYAYNKQDTKPAAKGYPLGYTPLDAGSVTLSGYLLQLDSGSLIDVSGSDPVTGYIKNSKGKIIAQTVAGAAGSVSLTFGDSNSSFNSEFRAGAKLDGLSSGSFSLTKSNDTSALELTSSFLSGKAGFDSYSFKSNTGLVFMDNIDFSARTSITLNAPVINVASGATAGLDAPYILLTNTMDYLLPDQPAGSGTGGVLSLGRQDGEGRGKWLDIVGRIDLTGLKEMNADFTRDIRLFDLEYNKSSSDNTKTWSGRLELAGDLTLKADRIYTGMRLAVTDDSSYGYAPSNFTISTTKNVTTNPADSGQYTGDTIYSAGGSLTIEAGGDILHSGVLAAPSGTITLKGTGDSSLVYLAGGSTLYTGAGGTVNFGVVDDVSWAMTSDGNTYADITGAPERGVTLDSTTGANGKVVMAEGANIDISGGGKIFGYQWKPGVEGTANPLAKTGTFVIVPGVEVPGEAVYLSEGSGIKAGVYSVLPVEYAFVPGALVVTRLGTSMAPGDVTTSTEGYTVVSGYKTFNGTDVRSSVMTAYRVRNASDVLQEGNFTVASLTAGDAGDLTAKASTTVLNGTVSANRLSEKYAGGKVTLAANDIIVTDKAVPLGAFDPADPAGTLNADLLNKLMVSDDFFKGKGFGSINLGEAGTTDTITVDTGSSIEGPRISLTADEGITIGDKVTLKGVDGNGTGELSVTSASDTVNIGAGALLQADGSLSLDVADLDLKGDLRADGGALNLTGDQVILAVDYTSESAGIFLTQTQWKAINGLRETDAARSGPREVNLHSRGSVTFQGNSFNMEMKEYQATKDTKKRGDLTIDAGRIASADGTGEVTVTANNITIKNTGAAVDNTTNADNETATITFNAANTLTIAGGSVNTDGTVASGDVRLDNFKTASLNADGDIVFRGKGALNTEGALNLTSARVTASYLRDGNTDRYMVANYSVTSGGKMNIWSSGGTAGTTTTTGGSLSFTGKSIELGKSVTQDGKSVELGGKIEVLGGTVKMKAVGTETDDGILLRKNAEILAKGTDDVTGGQVYLEADAGKITQMTGALIDVSAGEQGDAGGITMIASTGGVTLDGTINGKAGEDGEGGSFVLDTKEITDFGALNTRLSGGGFTKSLDIRARNGDVTVDAGQTVAARDIVIAADGKDGKGNIDVNGAITALEDAEGNGGRVGLYAQNNLTVSGSIEAPSSRSDDSSAKGGEVHLGSESGFLRLSDGVIDVSGGPNGGKGGIVSFRALRNDNADPANGPVGVNMILGGKVIGASQVVAEAFKVYDTNTQTTTVTKKVGNGPSETVSNETVTTAITSLNPVTTITEVTTQEGNVSTTTTTTVTSGSVVDNVINDTSDYMESADDIRNALLAALVKPAEWGSDNSQFHFRPGIEIRGDNLDLSANTTTTTKIGVTGTTTKTTTTTTAPWDLTANRFNGEPGILTLRASGNLSINENLVDHPKSSTSNVSGLTSSSALPSWDIGLVAGADFNAASPFTVLRNPVADSGKLTIGTTTAGAVVYSETGSIRFASAGDTVVHKYQTANTKYSYMIHPTMTYNLGTYSGRINGTVGGNMTINGVIQSAVGDIDLKIGGDLDLGDTYMGTIRTTGENTDGLFANYHKYGGGGSISLNVRGSVMGRVQTGSGWDYGYKNLPNSADVGNWGASYNTDSINKIAPTQGIATMAGGNLTVRTGGSFTAQAGTFGEGDLKVYAGGDIEGRFLVRNGFGELNALGNFAPKDKDKANMQVIEIIDAPVSVTAQGDVLLGAVLNPAIARSAPLGSSTTPSVSNFWKLPYGSKAAVSLVSRNGDVAMTGESAYAFTSDGAERVRLLPASVTIQAARNVSLTGSFTLFPSADRTLKIVAGKNIIGQDPEDTDFQQATILMPDADPDYYGHGQAQNKVTTDTIIGQLTVAPEKVVKSTTYQAEGSDAVEIRAGVSGEGDIENFKFYFTKKAIIEASGDINNIYYYGQNRESTDTTVIRAGGDIRFRSRRQTTGEDVKTGTGIIHGGPGALIVQAGGSIDLGTTQGIQSVGSSYNRGLAGTGSSILVSAGLTSILKKYLVASEKYLDTEAVQDFFDLLAGYDVDKYTREKGYGEKYAELLAQGKKEEAMKVVEEAREKVIRPLFADNASTTGNINMTSSQISSSAGGPISIIVNGELNVGKSAVATTATSDESNNSGIYTSYGGGINIFARDDVNVNESRVMTFMGGDIFTWSDTGDINAGRGSRTAISSSPPKVVAIKDEGGNITGYKTQFTPPQLGSGYRAVTYDPDGTEGSEEEPEAGDLLLFAPDGDIDAGEAGISGNRVVLGANAVLNAKNISFTSASVGVPVSESTVNLGALTGVSSLTESNKMIEQTTLGAAKDRFKDADKVEQMLGGWLDVKVISFDEEQSEEKKE